jgi:hypothetical protein
MNKFSIPLVRQDLLHHVLQVGGEAVCGLSKPEQTIQAELAVEFTPDTTTVRVEVAGREGTIKLRRNDRANHLHLRDFIQEVANSPAPV